MADYALHISDFINVQDPYQVRDEVRDITCEMFPDFDFGPIQAVFEDTVRLFSGTFPGYRKCNTEYHDLKHTTDVWLAMAGLLHGAVLDGTKLTRKNILLSHFSALFHDTGYIQTSEDTEGTGAKYMTVHVRRSIDFLRDYFKRAGFPSRDIRDCSDMLRCTCIATKTSDIRFRSTRIELLGKMLGTADLLGQMGDRNYLEKLLFLFYEFREAGISGYTDELDLLRKTFVFYDFTKKRLDTELSHTYRFMINHCRHQWGLDFDLYHATIKQNMKHLSFILNNHAREYRRYLRRAGVKKNPKLIGQLFNAIVSSGINTTGM